MLADPVPGAVWRPDALGWNVPLNSPSAGWLPGAYGQVPAGHHLPENRQNGQTGLTAGEAHDPAGVTKRQRIEAYLDRLGSEQAQNLKVREITSDRPRAGSDATVPASRPRPG